MPIREGVDKEILAQVQNISTIPVARNTWTKGWEKMNAALNVAKWNDCSYRIAITV